MHVLVISKSEESTRRFVEALRAASFEVHVAPKTADIVRIVREIPLGAIFLPAGFGAEANRFRETVRRLHPRCRVILVDAFSDASWVVANEDLAAALAAGIPTGSEGEEHRGVSSLVRALEAAVSALEAADPSAEGRTRRVVGIAEATARSMGLSRDTIDELSIASILRDAEGLGLGEILARVDFPWRVRSLVRSRHEKYDGSGGPEGVAGRKIPIGARILAAAEAYVAASSEPHAGSRIARLAGTALDPEVVEHLLAVIDRRAPDVDVAPKLRRDGVRGRLEAMTLPELAQVLVIGGKTAKVTVEEDGGERGEIWVERGAIVHGEAGGRRGADALYRMLLWDRGEFRIEHDVKTEVRSVEGDAMQLMLEGLRRRDETLAGRPVGGDLG